MSGRGAWIEADRQERLDRERVQAARRSGRLPMAEARMLIRQRFPEFIVDDGMNRWYDRHAVEALLALWREHGQGKVTGQMLRDRYAELTAPQQEAAAA